MKYKRMIIMIILLIFTVGMIMGTASASHTFKADGYKYKMSDKKFKVMKKHAKKHGSSLKKVKASKTTYWTSIEKWKVGKTYKLTGGPKIKVLKLIKTALNMVAVATSIKSKRWSAWIVGLIMLMVSIIILR